MRFELVMLVTNYVLLSALLKPSDARFTTMRPS